VSGPLATGRVGFSKKIRDCELIAVGTEEFITGPSGFFRQDQIGPHVSSPTTVRVPASRPSLAAALMQKYATNRTRGSNPLTFWVPKP
jgi:hypothetical protein